jgi:dihydroorotate dehydrogenase
LDNRRVVYQALVRKTLFKVGGGDAEVVHERTLNSLARLGKLPAAVAAARKIYGVDAPREVFGIRFANPIGLAAGMDKNGLALPAWPALGFGFVEVGTVTRHPQPGNERPRLFRAPDSEAIINRMGFNNAGAQALAARLQALGHLGYPLGISIGKSKVTPLEDAVDDYRFSLRTLYPYGDYFAVNVSSPNTPGLRSLQDVGALDTLLAALRTELDSLRGHTIAKPLLVKIAPDLTDEAITQLLGVLDANGVDGVIATNTTLSRDGLAAADRSTGEQPGGLSGRPLAQRAVDVVSLIHAHAGEALPIIGVGGIHGAVDARRMFDAGASLLQMYTGLIFRGPAAVRAAARAGSPRPSTASR